MHSLIHTWRFKRLLCLQGLDKYIHSAYSDIMTYQQTLPGHILLLSDLTECQPFCNVLVSTRELWVDHKLRSFSSQWDGWEYTLGGCG